jgi:hypothetical protein
VRIAAIRNPIARRVVVSLGSSGFGATLCHCRAEQKASQRNKSRVTLVQQLGLGRVLHYLTQLMSNGPSTVIK